MNNGFVLYKYQQERENQQTIATTALWLKKNKFELL